MANADVQLEKRLSTINPIALVNLLQDKGLGLSQILASTGIHAEVLKDAENQITYGQYRQLMRNAMALTGNRALGLEFGNRLNFSGAGVMSMGAMAAENFHQAMQFASRTTEVLNPSISFELEEEGDLLRIDIVEHLPWEDVESFIVETAFSLMAFIARMLDPVVSNKMIFRFRYPQHTELVFYQAFLLGELRFDSEKNSLYLPLEFANRPMPTFNPATIKQAEEILETQIQRVYDEKQAITQPIRQMIMDSQGEMLSIEDVATRFHVSSRTLNRRLKQMGLSFSEVVADVKYSIAKDLLSNSSDPIDQIAYKLGYRDPSNFSKAFKSWGGVTPSLFRESVATKNDS